jgi:diguanylate cyclase (GGDEF)-like protein
MLDIDFFKRINDCYGHQAGDLALRAFASLCRTLVRTQDTMARVGGEEFALLLPETGRAEAEAMAERLRAAVEGLRLEGVDSTMTVSVGVSEVLAEETEIYPALSRADQALYAAKRAGRNRVVHHDCAA